MLARRQKSGRVHYYYASPGTNRRELPLGSDRKSAIDKYHAMNEAGRHRAAIPSGTAAALHKSMVKNARPKGVPVSLTIDDVEAMLVASGGACGVTGIEFDSTQYAGHRIRPWMPSIDRIVPGGPYSRENTRIVCAAVNLAMNQFGEANFLRIAAATVLQQKLLRSGGFRRGADEVCAKEKTPEESGA